MTEQTPQRPIIPRVKLIARSVLNRSAHQPSNLTGRDQALSAILSISPQNKEQEDEIIRAADAASKLPDAFLAARLPRTLEGLDGAIRSLKMMRTLQENDGLVKDYMITDLEAQREALLTKRANHGLARVNARFLPTILAGGLALASVFTLHQGVTTKQSIDQEFNNLDAQLQSIPAYSATNRLNLAIDSTGSAIQSTLSNGAFCNTTNTVIDRIHNASNLAADSEEVRQNFDTAVALVVKNPDCLHGLSDERKEASTILTRAKTQLETARDAQSRQLPAGLLDKRATLDKARISVPSPYFAIGGLMGASALMITMAIYMPNTNEASRKSGS